MAALTLRLLAEVARFELGGRARTPLEIRMLANMAGEHLMSARHWAWAEGREVYLSPRQEITLTGATWTEATKRITKTGAFASYSHLSADTLEVTDGTGATLGVYEVAAKVDSDSITLATSIGAAANGQTDIEGSMPNDQVALPSDFTFGGITAYAMKDGLAGWLVPTSASQMLQMRSLGSLGSSIGFWALLRHVRSTAGGAPVPRLELWPRSTSAETEQLVLYYRAGWLDPTGDADVLSIPRGAVSNLYLELFKAFLLGNEKPELGRLDERLTALRTGVLWADAVGWDSTLQDDFGERVNTWLDGTAGPGRYDTETLPVTGP